jgi:hypothetical protein
MPVLRRSLQALALLFLLVAAAAPARAQVNFGNVEVGRTVSQLVGLGPAPGCTGTVTYQISGPAAGDYQVTGPTSIATDAAFSITVQFTPSQLGSRSASLAIGVSGGCGNTVALTGTGVAPRIVCPANITVSNAPNQCGAVVNYPAPTSIGAAGIITCSPASGSFFPKGTTPITCTSASGASCTFTVTVNDTQPPSITCPANLTVSTDPGKCGAVVNYPAPTASDNCPAVVTNCSPAPGSFLPPGTTIITCTATDAVGNTATCSFTVTVKDTEAPTITCPPSVILPTSPGRRSAAFTALPATATDNCPNVVVTGKRQDGLALTDRYPVGATCITWTATDASGNTAECQQFVTVHDPRIVGIVGLDTNGNGLPDPFEPHLKGVVVELRDAARDEQWAANPALAKPEPLDQTTTNEVGNFTFLVTPPAVYDVVVKPGPGQVIGTLFPGPSNLVQKVEVNGEARLRVTLSPGQTAAGLGILLK